MSDQLHMPIDLNHPLIKIRRNQSNGYFIYVFEMGDMLFSHDGANKSSLRHVDVCKVIMPIFDYHDDQNRTQQAIDTATMLCVYELVKGLMGPERRHELDNVLLFNRDTGKFQQRAFTVLGNAFFTAFPMLEVSCELAKGSKDDIERDLYMVGWKPRKPWYRSDGVPLPYILAPGSATLDTLDLEKQYANLKAILEKEDSTHPHEEACGLVKDMIVNNLLYHIYTGKCMVQNIPPIEVANKKLATRNLQEILRQKLTEVGLKHV